MPDTVFNILVAGVGGQGNLVSSRAIAEASIAEGLTPTVGQTFGASRRGGTVFSHIRLAKRQVAPLIPRGHLHVVLGMEPLESLRAVHGFAGAETVALVINNPIDTLDTLAGRFDYPNVEGLLECHSRLCRETYYIKRVPERIDRRHLNAFMLGVMASTIEIPLSHESLQHGIKSLERETESNLQAFVLGTEYGETLKPV